jgi:hypothetical protein
MQNATQSKCRLTIEWLQTKKNVKNESLYHLNVLVKIISFNGNELLNTSTNYGNNLKIYIFTLL